MRILSMMLLCVFALSASAQKMKITDGDLSFLKGEKEVNVEFVYDNMKMYKDDRTEAKYVEERTKELNEKSAGQGDTWAKKWSASRELTWEPKFFELINRTEGMTFAAGNTNAKYTLVVNSVWLYPGYNVGISRQGAKLNSELNFVETANRDKTLAAITAKEAPGDTYGGSYSNEDRIGECYAKTAKTLSKMIMKARK